MAATPPPPAVSPTPPAAGAPPAGGIGAWVGLTATLAGRALVNPALAIDLVRVAWRFRRRGWWHRPPFLPLPDAAYVRWRMHTAYGAADAIPPAADLIRYARWIGRQR